MSASDPVAANSRRDKIDGETILVNALCVGSGGNMTLARELPPAFARGGRDVVVLLTRGRDLHEEVAAEVSGIDRVRVAWAPSETAGRYPRTTWERRHLDGVARAEGATGVLQLNGMFVPGLTLPVLCHMGDPWPYLPVAWEQWHNHLLAWARRRAHARTLRRAERTRRVAVSFTSNFLRDLIVGHHRVGPWRTHVLYNGVPPGWIGRPNLVPPSRRGFDVVTVGNVSPYKRQEMTIRALPQIQAALGDRPLRFRILGHVEPDVADGLRRTARRLGVENIVDVEGRVGQAAVEQAYATARVCVLLSVCESFGIPVIEAQSFGAATIISRAGALPEIAGGASNVADADTPEAAAAAITRCLLDDAHADDLARRGLDNVRRFDWDTTARDMAQVLDAAAR